MKVERGIPLVESIIERLAPHVDVQGASPLVLDALETALMVELPPTLRRFLEFDFTFASFGQRWRGRGRFGPAEQARPRITSFGKMAAAMTDQGWTTLRLKHRIVRLPNLANAPWNCLYLGEARRDGELPILGMVNDETNVFTYLRYTAFDLYLVEQSGLTELSDAMRLDDFDSMLSLNPELSQLVFIDDAEPTY